ncbi:NACHT domain-containing protein [Umezawaea sp. NPDC059074]|uniref:NACHT domain-containing protein n=1 Tax=Umezawaea sp. NPDC059074 TaxID=3346716 RepID=UPI0036BA42AF
MSRQAVSYAKAAKLLGGESKVLSAIDKLSSLGLAVGAVAGVPALLGLFGPKNDILRHAQQVWPEVQKKLSGERDARVRTERLLAAHSVLAMSAYFEAFDDLDLGLDIKSLELDKRGYTYLAGGDESSSHLLSLAEIFLDAEIPAPSAAFPFEENRKRLESFYLTLSVKFVELLKGLEVHEILDSTKFDRISKTMTKQVPSFALHKYDSLFLKLASQFQEFFIWSNLYDHQATREYVRGLHNESSKRLDEMFVKLSGLQSSFGAVEQILSSTYKGNAEYAQSSLAIKYMAELDWPLVDRDSVTLESNIKFPRVLDGYVNPSCRVTQVEEEGNPRLGYESWWDSLEQISDVQFALAGLVSNFESPIVILGQPGVGKSLLTKVFAARLSGSGYLCVRVELRHVSPNAPIQRQIEEGLHRITGESTTWLDLVRVNPEVPCVILLDGLDELIQSTRANRSDYLELVQEFQERELGFGRPVTAIVTSRTIVANSTRFPKGSFVIRLDSFSDNQVELWLTAWNRANRSLFSFGKVEPLTCEAALRNGDLARQPLLLLMLAIYDADGNLLQRRSANLSRSDLYEKLLSRFSQREVISRDGGARLPEDKIRQIVERELYRLSVAAIAMFNRGRQWVSVDELNNDFAVLMPSEMEVSYQVGEGFHSTLSEAEVTFGRFFFVCEAKSKSDQSSRTYEFLHPTFGEYLVARYVLKAITSLDARRRLAEYDFTSSNSKLEYGLLFSLTAYASLAERAPVVSFLEQLVRAMEPSERASSLRSLKILFLSSQNLHQQHSYQGYRPMDTTLVAQLAFFASNIVLLIVVFSVGPVFISEIMSSNDRCVDEWRSLLQYWKSQMAGNSWFSYIELLSMQRIVRRKGDRDILLSIGGNQYNSKGLASDLEEDYELRWESSISSPDLSAKVDYIRMEHGWAGVLKSTLVCADEIVFVLANMVAPAIEVRSSILSVFPRGEGVGTSTGVNSLMSLLLLRSDCEDFEREAAYLEMINVIPYLNGKVDGRIFTCVLLLLESDARFLSAEFVEEWLTLLIESTYGSGFLTEVGDFVKKIFAEDEVRKDRVMRKYIDALVISDDE